MHSCPINGFLKHNQLCQTQMEVSSLDDRGDEDDGAVDRVCNRRKLSKTRKQR